jgi:3-deoxy-D-manno-octulosonic-acid transferase
MSYALYRMLTAAVWGATRPWTARRESTGGSEWRERLGEAAGAADIWVHAASVGEVAAAEPVVRALSALGEAVFLSVMTRTGRHVAARLEGETVAVGYVPLDFPAAVRSALDRIGPRALLLIETELWPNLVVGAARRGVTVGVLNARLTDRSVRRYRLPGFPLAALRGSIEFVAARGEADRRNFLSLGFEPGRVRVVGDLKFDRLSGPLARSEAVEVRAALGVPRDARVVVFGSVRPLEEAAVAAAAAAALAAGDDVRVVAAPRHLARAPALAERLATAGAVASMRSSGQADAARAIVLDTTGELPRVYGVADIAFVGGTLAPYGGHNPLEPAARGVATIVGPHTESCAGAATLLTSSGGALLVQDADGLTECVLALLGDAERRREVGLRAAAAVDSGRGGTERTIELLREYAVVDTRPGGERG